mgnify:CR=1 FL=1
MKTKAEQLEELKATAVKLQQQIEALEKPKQWEPRGGGYWVCGWGNVFHSPERDTCAPTRRTSKFGVERQTAEAAEKASDAMRTHNRLLAYVDEFGGDWEADWRFKAQNKYCITYDKLQLQWEVEYKYRTYCLGAVYMSKECAEGLVTKLESGEVVL